MNDFENFINTNDFMDLIIKVLRLEQYDYELELNMYRKENTEEDDKVIVDIEYLFNDGEYEFSMCASLCVNQDNILTDMLNVDREKNYFEMVPRVIMAMFYPCIVDFPILGRLKLLLEEVIESEEQITSETYQRLYELCESYQKKYEEINQDESLHYYVSDYQKIIN